MPTYMFTAKQLWQNQQIRNVFYYSTQDETTAGKQAIVDGLRAAWDTNLKASLATGWSLYAFDVRKVDIAGQPSVEYIPTSGALAGTNAAESLPAQIASLVTFTSLTSKPNKARSYLAGLTEAAVNGGVFPSSHLTFTEAWGTDTLDPTNGTVTGVARLTVSWAGDGSYVLGGNILTEVRGNTIPATQRRRRVGIGI